MMPAKIRHLISRLVPEQQKYRISMLGSHMSYMLSGILKGLTPLWRDDPEFCEIYRKIESRALLDSARAFVLLQTARRQKAVPGDILELGSYRCGSSLLLSANDTVAPKTLFFVDSFAGLPEVSDKDPYWRKGEMAQTNFEEIKTFLRLHLKNTPYALHKGFFPHEVDLNALKRTWSLVHIDTDLYQPTLDALRFFYPLLAPGGIVIIDDFGNSSCPGVVSAVREFEAESAVVSIFLISGQALIIKPKRGITPL
jgi:O-methyltransferase